MFFENLKMFFGLFKRAALLYFIIAVEIFFESEFSPPNKIGRSHNSSGHNSRSQKLYLWLPNKYTLAPFVI